MNENANLYTTKLPRWMVPGARVRVKCTAETRRNGIHTSDDRYRAFAGSTGLLTELQGRGWKGLWIEWENLGGVATFLANMVNDGCPSNDGEWMIPDYRDAVLQLLAKAT